MFYISTRGGAAHKRFCDILLEGLAPDGGLFLPAENVADTHQADLGIF